MATVGDVRVKLTGDTSSLQGALTRVQGSMKKFGAIAARIGKLVAAAFAGIVVAAVKAATVIEDANRRIQVGTGATGEALQKLKRDFKSVFRGVPDSAATVSDALASLNTLFGATGKDLTDLTKQVLNFSRLTGGDAAQNSLQFGRAMKQFGINARDSTDLLDTFFKITQDTGISFERLTRDLREFGPVLKLANIGADEGARLIANLSKEGINFTRVSPALRQGFINFGKAGLDARTELQKYIVRVKEAGSDQEATTILTEKFGTEVGRLAVAMRSGAFALDDNSRAVDRNRGAIAETEKQTRTFGDEMGTLRNKVTTAIAPIGDAFLTMFRAILPQINNFITTMGNTMPRAIIEAFKVISALTATIAPAFIGSFNAITLSLKAVALAALGVAVGLRIVAQSKAFNSGDIDQIKQATTALNDVKAVFVAVKDSIIEDANQIANAQQTAQRWADSVAAVGTSFEKTLGSQKKATEEVKKIEQETKKVEDNTKALKEPTDQFIGTISVAGKTIDIDINSRLNVTIDKLTRIRDLGREAAAAMGGV